LATIIYSMILFCDVETNFAAIIKERNKKPWNKNYARNKIPIDEKNIENQKKKIDLEFYETSGEEFLWE